ncbi:MAG TPA: hypothetical protein VIM34_20315 [Burkholderiaceae bacterium]
MKLTVNDRERLAYINGDAQTLALIDTIELERDDTPVASDALKVHEAGWETNAWCLARIVDALRAAMPLKKSQMRLLAIELQGLVDRLPTKGLQEHAFRARIDRICGLQE